MTQTERWAQRKALGLCVDCGTTGKGETLRCEPCRLKYNLRANEYVRRIRAERRIFMALSGVCPKCRAEGYDIEKDRCAACEDRRNLSYCKRIKGDAKRYAKLLRREAERKRRLVRSQRASGTCTRCGKQPAEDGTRRCGPCRTAAASYIASKRKDDPTYARS